MLKRRKKRIQEVVGRRQQGVLVIEDVHDPHNAAACLRSAEAFGFQKVYFIFETEKAFNPKKVGKVVASSGNKWLDYETFTSTKACITKLKKQGYEVIATVVGSAKTESIFEATFAKPRIALMLGNEHRGLSAIAQKLADRHITIPMRGFVESFNLSVFASLCLYEITRQRTARGMKQYVYSPQERKKLEKEFIKRGTK